MSTPTRTEIRRSAGGHETCPTGAAAPEARPAAPTCPGPRADPRPFWFQLLPVGVAGLVLLVACAAALWPLALVALVVVAVTAPVARTLGTRMVLLLIGAATCGAGLAAVGGMSRALALLMIPLGLAAIPALARASGSPSWRPVVGRADLILALGSVAVLATLVWPALGLTPEQEVLSLIPGLDDVTHFSIISEMVRGTGAVVTGYPEGFHRLMAGMMLASGDVSGWPVGGLLPYVVASAGLIALCAYALGSVAVDLARRMLPAQREAAAVGTAVAYTVIAPLGGLFAAELVLGHATFLIPVAVAACASWLALRSPESTPWTLARGIALLLTAAFVSLFMYPAVALAVVPGLAALALRCWRASRWPVRATGLAVGAVTAWVVVARLAGAGTWGTDFLRGLVSMGGLSVMPVTSLLVAAMSGTVLIVVARRRGAESGAVGSGLAAALGMIILTLGLVLAAWAAGEPAASSYYIAKSASGAWIAALPVVLAAIGVSTATIGRTEDATRGLPLVRIVAAACVALPLTLLPHVFSLTWRTPEGVVALTSRENMHSQDVDGAHLVAAAGRLGPDPSFLALIAAPRQWRLDQSAASRWLEVLRGQPDPGQDTAATCMDAPDWQAAQQCLERFLSHDPRDLVVVLANDRWQPELAGFAASHPDRVRAVRLA